MQWKEHARRAAVATALTLMATPLACQQGSTQDEAVAVAIAPIHAKADSPAPGWQERDELTPTPQPTPPDPTPEQPAPEPKPKPEPKPEPKPKDELTHKTYYEGYIDYMSQRCYVDRFIYDTYMREVFQARKVIPLEDETTPLPDTPPRLEPGKKGYAELVESRKEQWPKGATSLQADCEFTIKERDCEEGCGQSWRTTFRYGVYLPKQYMKDPDSVRSVVLLVPRERGGRTRWFLEPEPYKVNKKRMTQGLSLKKKMDAILAASPGKSAPIVVTMDDPGKLYTHGIYSYLTHDLLTHILDVYLPGKTRADVAFGIDAISSGSKNATIAFIQEPDAFDTFGHFCTHCHFSGFDPDRYFGAPSRPGEKAVVRWAERRKAGELYIKFSIGKADRFVGCNREYYRRLIKADVLTDDFEDYLTDCPDGIDPSKRLSTDDARMCTTIRPHFTEYPNIGHSFALMPRAFEPHMKWHVDKLDAVLKARDKKKKNKGKGAKGSEGRGGAKTALSKEAP